MNNNKWTYRGKPFSLDELAPNIIGFIYQIICLDTNRSYFGQKRLTKARVRKPLKGKKRRRRSRIQSDWETYWGSNKELQGDVAKLGPQKFSRSILFLCRSKAEMNYRELKQCMDLNVLLYPDKYYNSYVGTRISRAQLKNQFDF